MVVGIDSWFDYGCPSSMITRHFLTEELSGTGVEVRWHPVENGRSTWDPVWDAALWDRAVRPLAQRLGVPVSPAAPRRTSTRLAFQGYQYAADLDRGDAYSAQVFAARFTEGRDIADPAVLADAARRAGLDPDRFGAAARSPYYVRRHLAAVAPQGVVRIAPTMMADGYCVEGVPTGAQLAKLVALAASAPRAPRTAAEQRMVAPPHGDAGLPRVPGERGTAAGLKVPRARLAGRTLVEIVEGDLQELVERGNDPTGQPV